MKSASELELACTILAAIAVVGCTNRVGDLSIMSTHQVDLTTVKMEPKYGPRAKGSHCAISILIPVLPNLGKAVDAALKSSEGDALVDQVNYYSSYFLGIGSLNCWRVEGTPVKFTRSTTP